MKKYLLVIAGLVVIVVVLGGSKAMQIKKLIDAGASMTMPPTSVSTVKAEQQEWEQTIKAVGSLEAVQGVVVTADIPGRVTGIVFTPGADVTVGDVLIQQDISSEQAQLRAAEASVALAQANLNRITELLRKDVSSKSEFDTAEARFKEVVAQADSIRTTIDKKTVKAPFSGRLGLRQVNIGQDLGTDNPIVSLQAVDPIFVNFYVPQQELSVLAVGLQVRVKTDAVPNQLFTGKITAINAEVDVSTRNVKVQATLANDQQLLLPGMFGNVEVVLSDISKVLVVPVTAIAYATYGDSIFVVSEQKNESTGKLEKIASQQFVRLGLTQGDYVVVEEGIESNAEVVSAGVFKLRNGATLFINNEVQPEYSLNPIPEDT